MRLYLLATMIGAVLSLPASATPPGGAAGCPGNLKLAIDQACPCETFRNHGQYMNCVKTQTHELEKNGCNKADVGQIKRCAAMATCGQGGVVCCDARGRAKVMPADRCTGKGGTVVSGATSTCYASCQAAAPVPDSPADAQRPRARHTPRHTPRHLPPGASQ